MFIQSGEKWGVCTTQECFYAIKGRKLGINSIFPKPGWSPSGTSCTNCRDGVPPPCVLEDFVIVRNYFTEGTFPSTGYIPCQEIDSTPPQWQKPWNMKGQKPQKAEQSLEGPFQGTDMDGIRINRILALCPLRFTYSLKFVSFLDSELFLRQQQRGNCWVKNYCHWYKLVLLNNIFCITVFNILYNIAVLTQVVGLSSLSCFSQPKCLKKGNFTQLK